MCKSVLESKARREKEGMGNQNIETHLKAKANEKGNKERKVFSEQEQAVLKN